MRQRRSNSWVAGAAGRFHKHFTFRRGRSLAHTLIYTLKNAKIWSVLKPKDVIIPNTDDTYSTPKIALKKNYKYISKPYNCL